jgi:hypothetical protein
MANGIDKNLNRLRSVCAAYRERYDEWPAEARMEPLIVYDLTHILEADDFLTLASRLRLRTKTTGLSVGGSKGVVEYGLEGYRNPDPDMVSLSRRWLGVEARAEVSDIG